MKKILVLPLLALIIFSFTIVNVKSSTYSKTWIFGYDNNNDGYIEDPYGSINIYIRSPDIVNAPFTVTLKITYNKDNYLRAEYIYLTSLVVKIVDYNGNVKVSENIGSTNDVYPGGTVEFNRQLSTPVVNGSYYISISFILNWHYQGRDSNIAFDLYEKESSPSNLPSFVYQASSKPNTGLFAGLGLNSIIILSLAGAIGFVILVVALLKFVPSKVSLSKPLSLKSGTDALEYLTTLEAAVRVYLLDFEVKWFKQGIKKITVNFSTTKGVKVLKSVVKDLSEELILRDRQSFSIYPAKLVNDFFRLTIYIFKPIGVSIKENVKVNIQYELDGDMRSLGVKPDQHYIDENVIVDFRLRRNLSEAVNALLDGLRGLQNVIKGFAVLPISKILPEVSLHNIKLVNVGDKTLSGIEVTTNLDKFVLTDVKNECSDLLNIFDSKIVIGEIKPGNECYFSILSKAANEAFELKVSVGDDVVIVKDDSISLGIPNLLVSYSRFNVQKMAIIYQAIATILKSLT